MSIAGNSVLYNPLGGLHLVLLSYVIRDIHQAKLKIEVDISKDSNLTI